MLWWVEVSKTFVITLCHTLQQMSGPSSSASNPCLTLFNGIQLPPPPVMEKVLMGVFISFSNVVCVHDNLYNLSVALTCEHVDLLVEETMGMLHKGGGEFLTIKPSFRVKCIALCRAQL